MRQFTITPEAIKRELKENYDCITKLDAIKFIKKIYGDMAKIKDICTAYEKCGY